MEQVAWGCVGGADARARLDQSNRVHQVANRGHQRARMGQVAWGCVSGAEARASPNQSNRVQLVSHRGYLRARVGQVACVGLKPGLVPTRATGSNWSPTGGI